jgi:cobalamin biosynthesis protein CobD/CbiB
MEYFDVMSGRIDVALLALIFMVLLHGGLTLFAIFAKRVLLPVPILEGIIRSIAIKMIDRLNKPSRTEFALIIRGAIVFFILFALSVSLIYAIEKTLFWIGYGQYGDFILLAMILSPVAILWPAFGISSDIVRQGHYQAIAQGLNINLVLSDKYGLRRASARSVALGLCDWVVIPIIFYILGGIYYAYLFFVISLMIRVVGSETSPFIAVFGLFYRATKIIMTPILFFIIFIASFFAPGSKPLKTFGALQYPMQIVEAAFAFAQSIALGGAFQNRTGQAMTSPWVGPQGATAKLEHRDVIRVLIHYGLCIFLIAVLLLALTIYG